MQKILLFTLIATFLTLSSGAQNDTGSISSDTIKKHHKKNTLKWNLTPLIWNTGNVNLSYERATSKHGSFSVNVGYFVLPSAGLFDSLNILKSNKRWGFSVSGDKRWYFKKRNTKSAPDGLYWGLFGSVHYYDFENSFEVTDSEIAKGNLDLTGKFRMFSAGIELGYQFVLKNNITIDLIFIGPSLSTYSVNLGISGDLQVDKDSEYVKAIYDVLVSKFPGAKTLLNEKTLNDNGSLFTFGPGLRYMIQIGYNF
jgi:uncharacterized protein DUF3575